MKYINLIIQSPVFRGIDPEVLEAQFLFVRWQIKSYSKGSTLAFRGDDVTSLYVLLEGSINGVMTDPEGNAVKIEDIFAPMPIATGFLYGQKHFFPVDVIANTAVKVLIVPKEDFSRMMQKNAPIQENFLNLISNRAQFLTTKIRLLSRKTLKAKLAQIIIEQDPNKTGRVMMNMSQQSAADLIGVARPSLARTFAELLEQKLIEGTWKTFKIIKYNKLLKLLFD
ncbi:MAG: Crp/Fnr family transcriptional regulator [Bacteroidales bacterium]|nr:Crp/Fnr family transcriptional regulator [Bacteroidales bacterium]MDD2322783.1 Crp/Fnr family transcriptional regulator [Bacteroidales bacterium]MDD3010444.1 Crp/Fnr family transcriptional regulator [Bacteroidales bacterium]MDD3961082.1 Crp/Fnr family transcriptional regulator [Bacteroidales bacterium]MDY0284804.1 Crp/Fnr family transcriptional regulator [Bacteroidales bacterium]